MLKEISKNTNYLVNTEGSVFNKSGQEKAQYTHRDGYRIVRLYSKGKVKSYTVHRLVAAAFIPNPENKRTVNHIDGNKQNNHLSNLEWATDSENVLHAIAHGLLPVKRGVDASNASISEDTVHLLCKMLSDGYRNIEIVKKLNVTSDIVKNIRAGKSWVHISSLYSFCAKTKKGLSEQTVRWICQMFESGARNKDVVELSTNPLVTKTQVSVLRRRLSFPEITKDYNY